MGSVYIVLQQQEKEIHYVDINSLYPYVNKTKTYPVGHPEIWVHPEDQDIGSYFGIAKVKILPPPHLYHPYSLFILVENSCFPSVEIA